MQEPKTVFINFMDKIDLSKVNRFIQFTTEVIDKYNPTQLYFLFSSSGGDVDSGFVLHNFLLSLHDKIKITIHNVGTIDSIANVIFVAGAERYAAPNSSFLFHGVSMNFSSPQNRTALKEALSRMEGMENRIAETISKHSELTLAELNALFLQGEGKDVNFALDKKIINDIRIAKIPKGSVHLAMNFS